MTLPEMAARLNVSSTTIVNYETGRRLPDLDFLIDFSQVSERNFIFWLKLRVAASKSAGAASARARLDAFAPDSSDVQDFVELPLCDINDIGNAASMVGLGRVADEVPQFSTAWISRELHATPADLVQILVDDESMEPTLRPGDTILLDRRATRPEREGVYIMRMNGVALLKRLQILPGGIVKIVSDNPAYETFMIPLSDFETQGIAILGRVVWVVWAGRRI